MFYMFRHNLSNIQTVNTETYTGKYNKNLTGLFSYSRVCYTAETFGMPVRAIKLNK